MCVTAIKSSALAAILVAVLGPGIASGAVLPTADGYRGIWYSNQTQPDEYVYKYSGGLGTYCAKHSPFAVYAEEANKTFFCYGGTDEADGSLLHMVSYYDHATGTVPRPRILLDKDTDDAHDNPVISLDDNGHIWIFSSSHGTGRPSYISRSTEPYCVDEFERVSTTNFSYPQPHYVAGEGFLFLHTKYIGGRYLYQTTSADGITWTTPKKLAGIESGSYQVSWRHGNKVGTAFNYHPTALGGLNWRTNLYYMETDDFGATWCNAAGEELSLPLTTPGNSALVRDYSDPHRNVYMKDVAFDSEGRPVILYLTSGGWESGPENGPRTWETARWTGAEWDIHGSIQSDNNYDMGSLQIESDTLWRLIAPTETGPQPYNTGGEVVMWTSTNQGETWEKVKQLTDGSKYNHTYCRKSVNSHPDFYAFWADGHGRMKSDSRFYFTNRDGDHVWRLPEEMTGDTARPEIVEIPEIPGPGVLLSDNFNRADNGDVSADLPTGQAGSLAPVAYYEKNGAAIHGNQLRLTKPSGGDTAWVVPDHDFVDSAIIDAGGFVIEFDVDPVIDDTSNRNAAVSFGHSLANATGTDRSRFKTGDVAFGLFLVSEGTGGNGSRLTIANDWYGDVLDLPQPDDGVYHVKIAVETTSFDVDASGTVSVEIEGVEYYDSVPFLWRSGYNYINMEANTSEGQTSVYDNLEIYTFGGGTEPIPGDANRDDVVNDEDASILAAHWQQAGNWGDGDFNNDGFVNDQDASILAAHWQETREGSAAVPEPGMAVLLLGGLLSLLVWW